MTAIPRTFYEFFAGGGEDLVVGPSPCDLDSVPK